MKHLCHLALACSWIMGIAIAKGFWMVLGCVIFAPMSWVVFAEWIVERFP